MKNLVDSQWKAHNIRKCQKLLLTIASILPLLLYLLQAHGARPPDDYDTTVEDEDIDFLNDETFGGDVEGMMTFHWLGRPKQEKHLWLIGWKGQIVSCYSNPSLMKPPVL